jgi:hypothetical protein
MVCVARVPDAFTARVIAARLGSEGVLAQLRGGGIDGPYPMGEVQVLVSEGDLATAQELLLADEVEDALAGGGDGDDSDEVPGLSTRERLLLLGAVAAIVVFALARVVGAA